MYSTYKTLTSLAAMQLTLAYSQTQQGNSIYVTILEAHLSPAYSTLPLSLNPLNKPLKQCPLYTGSYRLQYHSSARGETSEPLRSMTLRSTLDLGVLFPDRNIIECQFYFYYKL